MESHALKRLVATLHNPVNSGPIELLLELWQHEETRLVCLRPKHLEFHPDIPVRIRGAFGRMLLELPPPITHRFDPFLRPPAANVLWSAFRDEAGHELPKPFVIDVDITGRDVIVVMRVFGIAQYWSGLARDALTTALQAGISIKSESQHFVPFDVISCTRRRVDGLDSPRLSRDGAMLLRSPLAIRHGTALGLSADSLIHSAFVRASGLARWQDFRLDADPGTLRRLSAHIALDTDHAHPVHFRRFSRRQPGREIPVMGMMGRLGLAGPLEGITPYLTLGTVTHIGSHAALGLGRYELAGYG